MVLPKRLLGYGGDAGIVVLCKGSAKNQKLLFQSEIVPK